MSSLQVKIIDQLKYVFESNDILDTLYSMTESYEKLNTKSKESKKSKEEPMENQETQEESEIREEPMENQKNTENTESPENKEEHNSIMDEINELKITELQKNFKKVKILFYILADLLKFKITQVNDERYQKVLDEQIKFPKNMDALILVMGIYGEAFDYDFQSVLLNIIDLPFFNDMVSISEIHVNMIPFVANEKINSASLKEDFNTFAEIVKNLACDVLQINTDFNKESMIEY